MKNITEFIFEKSYNEKNVTKDIQKWWNKDFAGQEPDSHADYINDMKNIVKGESIDVVVDIAKSTLVDEFGYTENDVNKHEKDIENLLKELAQDEIDDPRW